MDISDINPMDFSYVDKLREIPLLEGRVFLGKVTAQGSKGPIIVLVHGAYHGAWCYSSWLQYFDRAGIPSAAIDLPGHGGLDVRSDFGNLGVREYARTVLEGCRQLPDQVILVGHSLGALVVGLAAGQYRVRGLGLLAPSPPGQLESARTVTLVDEAELVSPPISRVCERIFVPGIDRDTLMRFHARLCSESPIALNDRYGLRVDVERVKVPAICIAAGNDSPITHPQGQDEAVAAFYGAEYHLLENAGHCFMLTEDWARSVQLLHHWYHAITDN